MTRPDPETASPAQLDWLRRQLEDWRAAGIIDTDQAQAIAGRYVEQPRDRGERLAVVRLLLGIGGAFVGIGLIWLVGANLDRISPGVRFGGIAAIWLATLLGSELLAARRASAPLVDAIRLAAALEFGAMVFQAAQSLHTRVDEPRLMGVWALGTLAYAYLTRAAGPLVVALASGTIWWLWQPLSIEDSARTALVALGAGALLALAAAIAHDRANSRFAYLWRALGGAAVLVILFLASLPGLDWGQMQWSWWLGLELAAGAALAVAALATARGRLRVELLLPAVALALAFLFLSWERASWDDAHRSGADTLRVAVTIVAYVVAAVVVAAIATLRRNDLLVWLAMLALVIFTTVQSFTLLAPIVTRAWLFLVLGVIFLGSGYLFDRARRRLVASIEAESTG